MTASATMDQGVVGDGGGGVARSIARKLKEYWGYATLHAFQREVIEAALAGRDAFVLMATGSGKSLCYQVPPLLSGKMVLVISPLVSLIRDQVGALKQHGILACCLKAGDSAVARRVLDGRYTHVYLTPEKLANWGEQLKQLHAAHGIGLVAVDESHCVSEWGHDFRPEFRNIHQARALLPGVPFMCLTATATARVRQDIVTNMRLNKPIMAVGSFNRPNLHYAVLRKQAGMAKDLLTCLKEVKLSSQRDGKSTSTTTGCHTIVYCPTRKETEAVAALLAGASQKTAAYHAGLGAQERDRVHAAFVDDQLDVLVATSAFGMGIDKPDIRRLVHWGAPKSLETYYQQTGRAGRDGQPAQCIMFFSDGDFVKNARLIGSGAGSVSGSGAAASELLGKMREFANATQCRRQLLLTYFGEQLPAGGQGGAVCCDNCNGRAHGQFVKCNVSDDVRLLLTAVQQTRGKFGLSMPVDVLMGSRRKQLVACRFDKLACHGGGRHRKVETWKQLARALLDKKLFLNERMRNGFALVGVDAAGKAWLKAAAAAPVELELPAALANALGGRRRKSKDGDDDEDDDDQADGKSASGSSASASWGDADYALYAALQALRTQLAKQAAVSPHIVFHNAHLCDMVAHRPTTMEQLLECKGVGQKKAAMYGAQVLATIAAAAASSSSCKESKTSTNPDKASAAAIDTLERFMSGASMEQVAADKKLKTKTVFDHLCVALGDCGAARFAQHPILTLWPRLAVPDATRTAICTVIDGMLDGSGAKLRIKAIKERAPPDASYEHIRLCLLRHDIERGRGGSGAATATKPAGGKRSFADALGGHGGGDDDGDDAASAGGGKRVRIT